jgi:hypothetical protein
MTHRRLRCDDAKFIVLVPDRVKPRALLLTMLSFSTLLAEFSLTCFRCKSHITPSKKIRPMGYYELCSDYFKCDCGDNIFHCNSLEFASTNPENGQKTSECRSVSDSLPPSQSGYVSSIEQYRYKL